MAKKSQSPFFAPTYIASLPSLGTDNFPSLTSDIAIFVLKRDVKLQLTNYYVAVVFSVL